MVERYPELAAAECDGRGWAVVRVSGEDQARQAKCAVCEDEAVAAALAGFTPPRFRVPVPLPAPVTAWAAKGSRAQGLYLCGPVGTGKTHTAWSAIAAWCAATGTRPRAGSWDDNYGDARWRSPNVVFTRLVDLLDDFRPGGDEPVRRVRDCQRAALLVIDDLGAEKASEWTQERLYSVVDHRYAACLPVLVTGNLPPRQIAEQTGDRVASRLAEMCEVVAMTGPDRRRPERD
jgi:DNA replication protein DnaC